MYRLPITLAILAVVSLVVAPVGLTGTATAHTDFEGACHNEAIILDEGTYSGSFESSDDHQGANFRIYDGQPLSLEIDPVDEIDEIRLHSGNEPGPEGTFYVGQDELRGLENAAFGTSSGVNFNRVYLSEFGDDPATVEIWPSGDGYLCLGVRADARSTDEWEITVDRHGTDVELVEVEELEDQVTTLEAEFASLAEENDELEAEIDQLEAEIADLEAELEAADGGTDELEDELERAEDRVDDLEDDLAATEAAASELEGELEDAEGEVTALEDELEDTEDQTSDLESELEDAEDRIATLEGELEDADVSIDVAVEPADAAEFRVGGEAIVDVGTADADPDDVVVEFADERHAVTDGEATLPLTEAGPQELTIQYEDGQESLVLDVADVDEESGDDSETDADDSETDDDGSETDADDPPTDGADEDSIPGFGLVGGLLAALVGAMLLARRR